jgi:hypothetical protein
MGEGEDEEGPQSFPSFRSGRMPKNPHFPIRRPSSLSFVGRRPEAERQSFPLRIDGDKRKSLSPPSAHSVFIE